MNKRLPVLIVLLGFGLLGFVRAETYECITSSDVTNSIYKYKLTRKSGDKGSYFLQDLWDSTAKIELMIIDETENFLWLAGTNHENGGISVYTINKTTLKVINDGMVEFISIDSPPRRGSCETK